MSRRGWGVVAAAAAICGAAFFVPVMAEDPGPFLPAEPREAGAHRFVFDGDDVVYEGPADDRGSVRGVLEGSPALSPQEAYAEAARSTLRALGAPDHRFNNDKVLAGADWDGDGVRDVLTVQQSENGTDFTARRGGDGSPIWSTHTASPDAFGVPAKVGAGEDGVLTVAYFGLGLVAGQAPTLVVRALGPDGAVRWERDFTGAWATAGMATVGVGLPLFGRHGQVTPSAAADVVVGRVTFMDSTHDGRVRTAFEVVDGRRGLTAAVSRTGPEDDELTPVVGPDMDGDGLDDVFLVGASTVVLARGADGEELWRSEGVRAGRARPVLLGDVTGDGAADVATSSMSARAPLDLWTTVLDGRTGRPVGFLRGGFPAPAGDVDGDGAVDVVTMDVERRATSTSVVYRTSRGTGRTLSRHPYSVTDLRQAPSYADLWDAGDVQGDGVTDRAHVVRAYSTDGAVRLADEGVVSGRTGLRLWSGRPGTRAHGSIRGGGAGEDLLVAMAGGLRAQDGATGQSLWTADLAGQRHSGAEAIGDVDGDGHGEVVAYLSGRRASVRTDAVVLSGLDGRTMWGTGLVLPAD